MTHKTVPVEPTEEMRNAGWDAFNSSESIAEAFYVMVKAAPPSPVTELEVMLANAATQAESDLAWVEKQAKGSNFQSSLILLRQALAAYEAKKGAV